MIIDWLSSILIQIITAILKVNVSNVVESLYLSDYGKMEV